MLEGVLVVTSIMTVRLIYDVIKLRAEMTNIKSELQELKDEIEDRRTSLPIPNDF